MVANYVVKVHCEGTHRPISRETQGGIREAGAEGSMYQTLGSVNRNLIPRLYRCIRFPNKPNVKRCTETDRINQARKRGGLVNVY